MADEVALGVVLGITVVHDRHDGAWADDPGFRRLHDLRALEQRLELADATLHVALLIFGGVVVAVLRQITQLARPFDLRRHLDPATRDEVVELCLEAYVRLAGEQVRFHG